LAQATFWLSSAPLSFLVATPQKGPATLCPMRRLSVGDAARFLAIAVVAFSAPDWSYRSNEEIPLPVSTVRRLGSAQNSPRGLQQGKRGPCVRALLLMVEPEKLRKWNDCVYKRVNSTSMTVAGAIYAASQECWCEEKVQETLNEFGCCQHPDYVLLCKAQCKPDCASAKALQCVKDCPAVCLEADYAPEFCSAACSPCMEHMLCIANHSIAMTKSGKQDAICDDLGFEKSTQWDAWRKCYVKHPKRTHWHRHNAENFCYCQSDLKAAASKSKCCDAKWGKTICDEQCAVASKAIDCKSAEGVKCMNDCKQTCPQLYTQLMVPACNSTCFAKDSKCAKYSVCEPVGSHEFNYRCDDDSKPMTNGCCPGQRRGSVRCPTLCDSGAAHYPQQNVAGFAMSHGLECQCLGCPEDNSKAKKKLKDTLENDLWQHGVAQLAAISKEIGILGANRKMQELMKGRNDDILAAFASHPGLLDAAFQAKVDVITRKYHAQIVAEAKRFKINGEKAPTSTTIKMVETIKGSFSIKMSDADATALATDKNAKGAFQAAFASTLGVKVADVLIKTIYVDGVAVRRRLHFSAPPRELAQVVKVDYEVKTTQGIDSSTIDTAKLKTNIQKEAAKIGHTVVITAVPTMSSHTQYAPAPAPTPAVGKRRPRDGSGGNDGPSGPIIAVAVVAGLCLLFFAAVVLRICLGRSKGHSSQANSSGPMGPMDGDTNVVVGRPVETGSGAIGYMPPAQGAPVQSSEKGDSGASEGVKAS